MRLGSSKNNANDGTRSKSAAELAKAAARMGGALDVGVGVNQFTIGGDVLSEHAADIIALIADVALRPALPASELPRLKADMLRRLALARSPPQQLALEKFHAVIYPDQPYGRIFPDPATVKGYTLEQVRQFYDRNLGAARGAIYVAGRFDEERHEPVENRLLDEQALQ